MHEKNYVTSSVIILLVSANFSHKCELQRILTNVSLIKHLKINHNVSLCNDQYRLDGCTAVQPDAKNIKIRDSYF